MDNSFDNNGKDKTSENGVEGNNSAKPNLTKTSGYNKQRFEKPSYGKEEIVFNQQNERDLERISTPKIQTDPVIPYQKPEKIEAVKEKEQTVKKEAENLPLSPFSNPKQSQNQTPPQKTNPNAFTPPPQTNNGWKPQIPPSKPQNSQVPPPPKYNPNAFTPPPTNNGWKPQTPPSSSQSPQTPPSFSQNTQNSQNPQFPTPPKYNKGTPPPPVFQSDQTSHDGFDPNFRHEDSGNGTDPNRYNPSSGNPQGTSTGLATASMILGILGLVTCCLHIGVIGSILAIILASIYNSKNEKTGQSTAGLVLGILGIVLYIAAIIALSMGLLEFFEYYNSVFPVLFSL